MIKPKPERIAAYVAEYMTFRNGQFYWTKKPHRNSSVRVGDMAGTKTVDGVVRLRFFNASIFRSHVVWILAHGEYPNGMLTHRNGNKLDDRIENLRLIEPKLKPKDNSLKLPQGITHQPRRNVWRVDVAGRHIGSYSTITDAMQAHRQAVRP